MKGVKIAPSSPVISNLCFADDTILFCQANAQEAEVVRLILNRYAVASGQIINMEKSTMVFSPNIRQEVATSIQHLLPFQVVPNLKERLWERVRGWNEHHLSTAGREVLIKAVLQAIPTYVMSCFMLPTSILEEVEKIIRRFWWGSKSSKGISWLAWARLCRPKAEGGMGF